MESSLLGRRLLEKAGPRHFSNGGGNPRPVWRCSFRFGFGIRDGSGLSSWNAASFLRSRPLSEDCAKKDENKERVEGCRGHRQPNPSQETPKTNQTNPLNDRPGNRNHLQETNCILPDSIKPARMLARGSVVRPTSSARFMSTYRI